MTDHPDRLEWFRYVRAHRVEAYKLVGWTVSCVLDGAHEGKTLMRYTKPSDVPPPEPAGNQAIARSIAIGMTRARSPAPHGGRTWPARR